MRGLNRLVEIRRNGYRPEEAVTLWMPEMPAAELRDGDVECETSDAHATADLRAFVGLPVHVLGNGREGFGEADAWGRALMRCGASSVFLSLILPANEGFYEGPVIMKFKGEDIV